MDKLVSMEQGEGEKSSGGVQNPESTNIEAFEERDEAIGLSEEELKDKVKELEEQAARNYDLYLRTYAEMDNLKKRFQKERENIQKFGNESLLKSLLGVLDNLESALQHVNKGSDINAIKEGLELTIKGFKEALERAGVTVIEAVGKPFDPYLHEAIMEKESDTQEMMVIEELQKGYRLYDRLLRPSKVVISKGTKGNQTQ